MLKYVVGFIIILGLVLGSYWGGLIELFTLRIISYVLIFFGFVLAVLMGTAFEEVARPGMPWIINVGAVLLFAGLVLAFLPL
ncbi:MAG: hypothetical protein ACE5FW_02920 [Candidatus Aenigmatarchaeota archaeon]